MINKNGNWSGGIQLDHGYLVKYIRYGKNTHGVFLA